MNVESGTEVPTRASHRLIPRLAERAGRLGAPSSTGRLRRHLFWIVALSVSWGFSPMVRGQSASASLPNLQLSTGGTVNAVVLDETGKVTVGGLFSSINGVPRQNLARLSEDGSVDLAWKPQPDGAVQKLVATRNGIIAAGSFGGVGGLPRNGLVKLNSVTGEPDAEWNPSPPETEVQIECLLFDGAYVYVGGSFLSMGGQPRYSIARLDPSGTGSADPFWDPSALGTIKAIFIDERQNVYLGGNFTYVGRWFRDNLARVDYWTGIADSQWNPLVDGEVSSLLADDNFVYAGGHFDRVGDQPHTNLVRVGRSDGIADPAWLPEPDGNVESLVWDRLALVVGGRFLRIGGALRNGIAKIDPDGRGTAYPSWNALVDPDVVNPVVAVAGSGTNLYVGGSFHRVGKDLSMGIAKLDGVNGARIPAFSAQVQQPGQVKALVIQPDNKIVVGGDFYFASDVPRYNLLRLLPDLSLDRTWAPDVNGPVFALAADNESVFVGGSFSAAGGQQRTNLARFPSTDGSNADPYWNPAPQGGYAVFTLALNKEFLYVGGAFEEIGGAARRNIAKLNRGGYGEADPIWAPATQPEVGGEVVQMRVSGNYLYVAGNFGELGGQVRNTLTRLELEGAGAADPAWVPNLPDASRAFAFSGTNLYVVTGQSVAKVSTADSGSTDPAWDVTADDYIRTVSITGDDLYVGGNFRSIAGVPRKFVARFKLSSVGAPDLTWDRPIDDIYAPILELMPWRSGVLASGSFTSIGGLPVSGVAFLAEAYAPVLSAENGRLFVRPSPRNGTEVTHFRITQISGGILFLTDGQTRVNEGDFITADQGSAGLRYAGTPAVIAVACLNQSLAGSGTAAAAIELPQTNLFQPSLSILRLLSRESLEMQLTGQPGGVYSIVTSPELLLPSAAWIEVLRLTNTAVSTVFTNKLSTSGQSLFFQAKQVTN